MASQVLDIVIKATNDAASTLDGMKTQLAAVGAAGAAIGVLATKSFVEFDSTMVKLRTQVGLSETEVSKLNDTVKQISSVTAVGPVELADALFTIESAGVRGEAAVALLDSAAKAAAVGFGTTREVAQLLTATIATFGEENITASEAMDILAQTVESGNFEAADLASSLGKVLPISQSLGVSMGETGAFIATFTKSGATASEAVTALRATLSAVLKPTADMEEALEAAGLTVDDLKERIATDGLATTLVDLRQTLEDNDIEFSNVIGSVEGLAATLFVTGEQSDSYIETARLMTEANGKAAAAFDIVSESAGFQFDQAWNELKLTLLEIGSIIVPMMIPLVEVFADAVKWVNELDPGLQTAIVGFGAVVTAVGFLAVAFGPLIVAATSAGIAMTAATAGIPLAIAAIVAGIVLLVQNWDAVVKFFDDNKEIIALALAPLSLSIAALILSIGLIKDHWRDMTNFLAAAMETAVNFTLIPINTLIEGLNRLPGIDISPLEISLGRVATAANDARTEINLATNDMGEGLEDVEAQYMSVEAATVKVADTADRELPNVDQLLASIGLTADRTADDISAIELALMNAADAADGVTQSMYNSEQVSISFRTAEYEAQLAADAKWDILNAKGREYALQQELIKESYNAQDKLLANILAKKEAELEAQILLNAAIPELGGEESESGYGSGTNTVTGVAGQATTLPDGSYNSAATLRVYGGIWRTIAEYNQLTGASTGGSTGGTTTPPPPPPEPPPATSPPTSTWTGPTVSTAVAQDLVASGNGVMLNNPEFSQSYGLAGGTAWFQNNNGVRYLVYHQGGVVPGPRGSEHLALLQAGETVLPTQNTPKAGGGMMGGVTIIVNNNGPVTGNDQASQLQEVLNDYAQRGYN